MNAGCVVLQSGNFTCPMADLERFCRELSRNRDNDDYKNMCETKVKVWKAVLNSPAARLTSQRAEIRLGHQPRLLRELIELYANHDCDQPCDHVYALHSLVDENRERLCVDYKAKPVERFVAVLRFVNHYEALPPSKVLGFATLLLNLLRISQEELKNECKVLENFRLEVSAQEIGEVELLQESRASLALRKAIQPLQPMRPRMLTTSPGVWTLSDSRNSLSDSKSPVRDRT